MLHTKQGDGQSGKSSSLRKTGDYGQQDTMPMQRAGNRHGPVGSQSEEAVCSDYWNISCVRKDRTKAAVQLQHFSFRKRKVTFVTEH